MNARILVGVVLAVAARPWLWATALGVAARTAPNRWWARPPFLPVPDAAYWHFRTVTAFGDARPSVDRLLGYIRWCRRMGTARG